MSNLGSPFVGHEAGVPIAIGERIPRKIRSGWVGVYRSTREELRLCCLLLPGDIITAYPGCFMQGLTHVCQPLRLVDMHLMVVEPEQRFQCLQRP